MVPNGAVCGTAVAEHNSVLFIEYTRTHRAPDDRRDGLLIAMDWDLRNGNEKNKKWPKSSNMALYIL
jgi:hypothetical protein